jgi:hypothetical protein
MNTKLTQADINWLALEGCEFIGFESGTTVDYDVAGYQRCSREERPPESLEPREGPRDEVKPTPLATFYDDPYPVRIAGFRRRDIFGPDEIGSLFRRHAIPWSDGLGNGLYESLRIDRKYGLKHVLEAPILGFDTPFLEEEWVGFRKVYPQEVMRLASDMLELESVYGGPLARTGDRMMVLWTRDYPLAHFWRAYQRNPEGVKDALQQAIGRAVPPVQPETQDDEAALVRFWAYVRRQHGLLVAYQARVLRRIMGEGLKLVANPHELPPLDMGLQAQAYDYPAVAIRPLLLSDPVFLRHYLAYFTQLHHDLCGKPPMVSVRMNLSAATPQFIPTGDLIRHWYNQVVRHGAGGLYFWTRDYPTDSDPETYDGPIPGNPVASTLPQERWDVSLDILGHLATHRVFRVPPAELLILVPWDSALLHRAEWRRIYAAFSACAEAGIHARFVSDRQIEGQGFPESTRLVLAPVLDFISPALRKGLTALSQGNGTLFLREGPLYNRAGDQVPVIAGAATLPEDLFSFFPIGGPGSADALENAAAWVRRQVEDRGIDDVSWVFDVTCDSLPSSSDTQLRDPDPSLRFSPWLYEHGSEWIMPYL